MLKETISIIQSIIKIFSQYTSVTLKHFEREIKMLCQFLTRFLFESI